MNNITEVKNLHNTTGRTPADGSDTWQEYWEKSANKKFFKCANLPCTKEAEVGAHVKENCSNDNHWYIVPLCKKCNAKTDIFEVDKRDLIQVNKK